jgi:transposase
VGNGSGVSRGDRNRNARLARLRERVPASNAIAAIDLADGKQMLVVVDHDSRVLARLTLRCRAWQLGAALDWGRGGGVRWGDGGVRADRAPLASRRPARRRAGNAVRVRADPAGRVGAAE